MINPVIVKLNISNIKIKKDQPYFDEVTRLKSEGVLKTGSFTIEHDKMILSNYDKLVAGAKVEKSSLESELFAKNFKKEFKLEKNLVGVFLLQDLPDWAQRLPVEVVARLATLHMSGAFSEQEDALLLAWVKEHGPTDWPGLAETMGRTYHQAATVLSQRHQVLEQRWHSRKRGAFDLEEVETILEEVLTQKPTAISDPDLGGLDWDPLASLLNRQKLGVYGVFSVQLHPLLRRWEAGTLDRDARPGMVQVVKEQGWIYSAQVLNIPLEINFKPPQLK